MNKFSVSESKNLELQKRMAELGIRESDIVEKFIRGSGAGGQKINKTSSCVYLIHSPTGIEVRCQRERSQALNRYLARRELCNKIEARIMGKQSAQKKAEFKIKKQKQRRSRKAKAKMIENKRRVSAIKSKRGRVGQSNDD